MRTEVSPTAMMTVELIKEAKRQAYAEVADWLHDTYSKTGLDGVTAGDIYDEIGDHFRCWDYMEDVDNERK